jgi:hypothetical protein
MSVDLISRSKSLATSSDGLPAANTLRDLRRLAATFGPEIGLRDLSTGSPMTASGGRRRGASMAYQAAASICRTLTTLGRRIFRPAREGAPHQERLILSVADQKYACR